MKSNQDYIFGTRPVIEAIESGKEIDRVFIRNGLKNELFSVLFSLIKKQKIPFQFVPVERLNRITRKNHQGIIAFISEIEYKNIEEIIPYLFENGIVPFVLILDRITDVRNFGSMVRTAECAGVHAVLVPDKGAAAINADAFKTSSGALHQVNICRTPSLPRAIDYLKKSGLQIITITEKAEKYYYDIDFKGPCGLVMGAEDKGISTSIRQMADHEGKIPVLGKISSLNVSNASAILMYEVVKQRVPSR